MRKPKDIITVASPVYKRPCRNLPERLVSKNVSLWSKAVGFQIYCHTYIKNIVLRLFFSIRVYWQIYLGWEFRFRLEVPHILKYISLKWLKHFCDYFKHKDVFFLLPTEQNNYESTIYITAGMFKITCILFLIVFLH